jgi:hypothetical protein
MRFYNFILFVGFLAGLSSVTTSSANSTRLGPCDASKAQNSTEHDRELGITPIAPYSEKQTSEEWQPPWLRVALEPALLLDRTPPDGLTSITFETWTAAKLLWCSI